MCFLQSCHASYDGLLYGCLALELLTDQLKLGLLVLMRHVYDVLCTLREADAILVQFQQRLKACGAVH